MRVANYAVCSPVLLLSLLLVAPQPTLSQSLDLGAPTPIRTTEVVGRIVARDLGDARLTDHYYALAANPGDLVVTVVGNNLNGDVDIFTTAGLRPLLKFSMYAESSAPISKTIFLRKREDLILRVEARTPNDDEGTYQIRFAGSFEPIAGGPFLAEDETKEADQTALASRPKPGRRVSSVGARIEEPPPPPAPVEEVAAAPAPTPTPEPVAELPVATPEKPAAEAEAEKPPPPRPARTRRPANRRSRSRPQPQAETETAKTVEQPSESTGSETSPRRGSARRNETTANPPETPAQEAETGPRLMLETADGTLINRSMSTLRRVMVENGVVVIVGKDGRVQRVPLAQVVRMVIAP
jgi:hypothetical protein